MTQPISSALVTSSLPVEDEDILLPPSLCASDKARELRFKKWFEEGKLEEYSVEARMRMIKNVLP